MKAHCKYIFLVITTLLSFVSCNKLTPAGFWKDYQTESKQTEDSNQGPRGGYTKIVWHDDLINTFDREDVLNYATRNGWHLTDCLSYINGTLNLQTTYDELDYSCAILREEVLPLLKPDEIYEILVFTSGWIAVEPGNAQETEKNGFVVFNLDRNRLLIYHLWGE